MQYRAGESWVGARNEHHAMDYLMKAAQQLEACIAFT